MTDLTENRYVIDSSAWIEYFEGKQKGLKVREILLNSNNSIYIPNIVFGEVISKIARSGKDVAIALEALLSFHTPF